MTVPVGTLSLGQVAAEVGLPLPISLGDPLVRALGNVHAGTIKMGDLAGTQRLTYALTAVGGGSGVGYSRLGTDSSTYFGNIVPTTFRSLSVVDVHVGGVGTTRFLLTLSGTQNQNTTFNSVLFRSNIYYPAEAAFFSQANGVTTWGWDFSGSLAPGSYTVSIDWDTDGPGAATPVSSAMPVGQGTDFTLTFEDHFTGSALDPAHWVVWPNVIPADGGYAVGGSYLKLAPMNVTGWTPRYARTQGLFQQNGGYFEIKCRLPIGLGVWPMFKLRNYDGGASVAVTVFEAFPGSANSYWANASHHPMNYTGSANPNDTISTAFFSMLDVLGPIDLTAADHVYGVKWTATDMFWYFDGQLIAQRAITGPLAISAQTFLEIGVDYGSESGSPTVIDTPTGTSSNPLAVDYVRVWTLGGTGGGGGGAGPIAPPKVEFYGNATMWGYKSGIGGQVAVPPPASFAAMEPALDARNEAVPGKSIVDAISGTDGVHTNWSTLMTQSTAKYVVLMHGLIDFWNGRTVAQFQADLQAVLNAIKLNGKQAVMVTPCVNSDADLSAYAQAVRDVAAQNTLGVIDVYTYTADMVTNGSGNVHDYLPDGTHPSEQVYIQIGQYIAANWSSGSGVSTPSNPNALYPYGRGSTNFTLTFNEEFDGTDLDPKAWNDHIWWTTPPATKNWSVANGALNIWPQQDANGNFFDRHIDTDGKFYQTYGYFECKATLPVGRGTWPAFWLYNHDDPNGARPEIDIMEAYSGGALGFWANGALHPINVAGTVWSANAAAGIIRSYINTINASGLDFSAGDHYFGCLWESDGITFYVDGVQMGSKVMEAMPNRMYMLLDIMFGSASGTPNVTETPQGPGNSFSVKHVRAWSIGATTNPNPQPTGPIKVDYYGASGIYGYDGATGLRAANPSPAVFASLTGYTTTNYGVPSNSTTKALAGTDGVNPAFSTMMTSVSTATHVIISLAINDWALTETQYKANLTQMITLAKNAGRKVILQTTHPTYQTLSGASAASDAWVAGANQWMRDVAVIQNCGLIDVFQYLTDYMAANGITGPQLTPDGLHPTQSTYTLIGTYAANRFAVLK